MDQKSFPYHWRFKRLSMLMTFDTTTMLGEKKKLWMSQLEFQKQKCVAMFLSQ